MRGNWSVSADGPVPPTTISFASVSSNRVNPDACQVTHTLVSLFMLPTQRNRVGSNFAASIPSSGSKPVPLPMMPKAVPSFGPTLESQFASRRLPAPGMLRGTIVGLPGMCLLI